MKDTELYARLLKLPHPWTVKKVELDVDDNRVDLLVKDAPGAKHPCPICKKLVSIYDHQEEQTWRHLDTCQCETHLHARLPRTKCPKHGVHQVVPPWAEPRSGFTLMFEQRLIDTLRECDVTGATRLTGTTWDIAWRVMEKAVERGWARKDKRVPEKIGIDEKSFAKRHSYETIVCNLKKGTVEYVIDKRKQESLEEYYGQFSSSELSEIQAVAMDMWKPFINATMDHVPDAEDKIVFDRFHVFRFLTDAVDKVRREEAKTISVHGDHRLKKTRYLWLKNYENLTGNQRRHFAALKSANLQTARAWAIKETFRNLWNYKSMTWAGKFFRRLYFWATHSQLMPIVKAAKTMKNHLYNIMTYFKHPITNATAKGINSKIQMIKNMACGFRNRKNYRTAIYFHCGGLDLYPRLEGSQCQ